MFIFIIASYDHMNLQFTIFLCLYRILRLCLFISVLIPLTNNVIINDINWSLSFYSLPSTGSLAVLSGGAASWPLSRAFELGEPESWTCLTRRLPWWTHNTWPVRQEQAISSSLSREPSTSSPDWHIWAECFRPAASSPTRWFEK